MVPAVVVMGWVLALRDRPNSYPVVGDWDGSGTDTVGVRSGETWHLNDANDAGPFQVSFDFGATNDLPVVWVR